MTDEERAEEYTNSINTLIYDIEDNAIDIAKYLRKAYLDGLVEGRKAEADKIFDEWCSGSHDEPQECGFLKQLKNENAELKEQSKRQIEAIKVYLEQIENLKCCENCKKHRNRECSEDKKFYARTQKQCDEWELAE